MKPCEPGVEDMLLQANAQYTMLEECVNGGGVGVGGVGEAGVGGVGGGGVAMCGRRLLARARAGDVEGVRALMAGGAPFAADWLGTSPLHAAAAGDHADCIRVLLRAGVSRDARTKVERTPLHVAASAGHAAATRALLQGGADVGARDMLRMTPLHWAAQRGHVAVARLLLAAGADHAPRNKFGLTPRQLAARAQHHPVLHLLDEWQRSPTPAPAPTPTPTPAAHSPTHSPPRDTHTPTPQSSEQEQEEEPPPSSPPPIPPPAPSPAPAPPSPPGAAVLRRHGITLLPRDECPTVLRALNSGRTIVLSDAGKLLLKQATGGGVGGGGRGAVVVRAARARGTPPAGGKVFTLTGATVAPPGAPAAGPGANVTVTVTRPRRKVIHPQDVQLEPLEMVLCGAEQAGEQGGGGRGQEAGPLLQELYAARASEREMRHALQSARDRLMRAEAALIARGLRVPKGPAPDTQLINTTAND